MQELERFGIPLVPVVVVGDRAAHGWNPKAVAELLGVDYREGEPLSPEELTRRLDSILVAAQRAIRQVPPEHLGMTLPGRDRTVRQLGYHVFRLSLAFQDGMEQGRYPETWLLEEPPAELAGGEAIAQYGQMVRERLAGWLRQSNPYQGEVHTYYGPQTGDELLERTTWHAAQHLRQLYACLERMGKTPHDPLTETDFRGLPLPKELW